MTNTFEKLKCHWCGKEIKRTTYENLNIKPSGRVSYCDTCWSLRVADIKAYAAELIKRGVKLKKSLGDAVKIIREDAD